MKITVIITTVVKKLVYLTLTTNHCLKVLIFFLTFHDDDHCVSENCDGGYQNKNRKKESAYRVGDLVFGLEEEQAKEN